MIDDRPETLDAPIDGQRVSIEEPWDLDYWTKRLEVNASQLRRAIKVVGNRERDLAAYLGGNRRTIW